MHLSDLHIGKRVNEFPMLEDQKYILKQILRIIDEEKTDGVMIAGDVYDRKEPSTEAVQLFDEFLVQLAKLNQKVFIISGNHDSAERLSYAGRLLSEKDIYISPVYHGEIAPIKMEDAYGEINFYLLPFVKPVNVRQYFEDEEIANYTDAIRTIIDNLNIDTEKRNVLLMHQFVTGASLCDSEEHSVGGLDDVNVETVEAFDYVALGHIHGPQKIGRETIRYCGTPLKYSFSEENHKKSVTIVELKEKGKVSVDKIPLVPMRDMKTITGTYEEITARSYYEGEEFKDWYLHIILKEDDDVPEALGRLRAIYPNIMKMNYDNQRTRSLGTVCADEQVKEKTPFELFSELYTMQNGVEMSKEQAEYLQSMIVKIWGE